MYAGVYETPPPEETFFEKARKDKLAMEEGQGHGLGQGLGQGLGMGSSTGHLAAATLTQEQLKTHFQGRFGHNDYDTRTAGAVAGASSDHEMGDDGMDTMATEWRDRDKDTLMPTLRSPSPGNSFKSAKSLRMRNAQSNQTAPSQIAQSNQTAPSSSDPLPAMPTMHTLGTKRRDMIYLHTLLILHHHLHTHPLPVPSSYTLFLYLHHFPPCRCVAGHAHGRQLPLPQ